MKLGPKVFAVLQLEEKGGGLTGTFRHPEHFQTGDGVSFSQISSAVAAEPISRASLLGGSLHFVVGTGNDTNQCEMRLTGADQATLKFADYPFDGWTFTRNRAAERPAVATDWDPRASYPEDPQSRVSSEMKKIYEDDQKPRQNTGKLSAEQWTVIAKQDQEHRKQTRDLLAAGKLHTGEDFEYAAFIFQHGDTPEDYLLAHTLAMVAVSKGDANAIWIGSATLDRYLQSIGKPQIYGTQFKSVPGEGTTQEPYNRDLISDALRQQLHVPSLAAQQEQLKYWRQQFQSKP